VRNKVIPTSYTTDGYPPAKQTHTCACCGKQNLMYIISTGDGSEVTDDDHRPEPEPIAYHQWQVLLCSSCKRLNIIQLIDWTFEREDHIDAHGNEWSVPLIRTYYLYPNIDLSIPMPHPDMPESIREDYEEARGVFLTSARSAAALLRLAIQKLCKELGEKGKHIDTDIGELVKKGLPEHIQQALDIVRVIGNEAVHPGELNVRDDPKIAKQLFELVNEIVEDRISLLERQNKIKQIYGNLPQSKLDAIKRRDH
jgi:hypothetical protein